VVSLVYLIGVAQTVFALVDLYTHANTLYCPGVLIEHFPASHYWFSLIGSSAVGELLLTESIPTSDFSAISSGVDSSMHLCSQSIHYLPKVVDIYSDYMCPFDPPILQEGIRELTRG
jgi:hypothetical protein